MKRFFYKTAAIFAFLILFSVFPGCSAENHNSEEVNGMYNTITEPNILIINYYEKTSGSEEAFELVLYSTENPEELKLSEFITENGEETRTDYLVPKKAAEDCFEIIKKYELAGWEGRNDLISLDGVKIVCKFLSGEKVIRVSSEEMPENGDNYMRAIKNVLLDHKKSAKEFFEAN